MYIVHAYCVKCLCRIVKLVFCSNKMPWSKIPCLLFVLSLFSFFSFALERVPWFTWLLFCCCCLCRFIFVLILLCCLLFVLWKIVSVYTNKEISNAVNFCDYLTRVHTEATFTFAERNENKVRIFSFSVDINRQFFSLSILLLIEKLPSLQVHWILLSRKCLKFVYLQELEPTTEWKTKRKKDTKNE